MAKTSRKVRRAGKAATPQPKPVHVNEFADKHGLYETGKVVDLSGELGEGRQRVFRVSVNRGGTAIERWMNEPGSKLFDEPQRAAIRHCQALWARAIGLGAVDPSRVPVDGEAPGWAQHEAMAELASYKTRIPRAWWDVFENVCRFDMPAGTAGSALATNRTSAIDRAKTAVAFVASMIAMWRGLG